MTPDYQAEIVDLHRFFVAWFNGEIPESDETFSRFTDVTSPGFVLIGPSGALADRDTVANSIRNAHNGRPDLRIWIKNFTVRHSYGHITVVTYEEWQHNPGEVDRGRLSTAIFEDDASKPNGVIWLHVHETWLPG